MIFWHKNRSAKENSYFCKDSSSSSKKLSLEHSPISLEHSPISLEHSPNSPKRNKGFTLIELMITIAVAALLVGVAIPSFTDLISNNRAAKFSNEFTTAFKTARANALSRNVPTFICASSDANTEDPSCGDDDDWNQGFLIYSKPSNIAVGNGNTLYVSGAQNDTLIYQYSFGDKNSSNITVDSIDTINGSIGFNSNGFIWQEVQNGLVTPSIILCDSKKAEDLGTIYTFSVAGRMNTTKTDKGDPNLPKC